MTRRGLLGAVGAAAMFPPLASGVNGLAPRMPAPALQIGLRIAAPQAGAHGRRHAVVQAGLVTGSLMRGIVQTGRLTWLVDPASGAAEVELDVQVVRADGVLLRLRDRTTHATADALAGVPGLPTAPELFDATGEPLLVQAQLAGRLDPSQLRRGVVWLRAFESADRLIQNGNSRA